MGVGEQGRERENKIKKGGKEVRREENKSREERIKKKGGKGAHKYTENVSWSYKDITGDRYFFQAWLT